MILSMSCTQNVLYIVEMFHATFLTAGFDFDIVLYYVGRGFMI